MSRVERKTHKLKLVAKTWGSWREVPVTGDIRSEAPHLEHLSKMFINNRFRVDIFYCGSEVGGVVHACILRHGLLESPDAQEVQRIKSELFGIDSEAVEIFPAKATSIPKNVRHLWILPTTWKLPFGFESETAWGGK